MKHKCRCYKNIPQGPAGAEEKACVEAARRLLYNKLGQYCGDDEAAFLYQVISDNDTQDKDTCFVFIVSLQIICTS